MVGLSDTALGNQGLAVSVNHVDRDRLRSRDRGQDTINNVDYDLRVAHDFLSLSFVLSGRVSLSLPPVYHGQGEFVISFWVIAVSALSISLGTAIGGWRVIRTLGLKMTTLRPINGFAASASAATVIEVASHFGIPVSTAHCLTSAVMGVGSTRRLSAVRWGIARDIVLTWILTFPSCGIIGWIVAMLLKIIF